MKRKYAVNFAREKQISLLTGEIENLQRRVARLEAVTFDPSVALADGEDIPEGCRLTPTGKKSELKMWHTIILHDELQNLLRGFWPKLGPLFATRISAEQKRAHMEAIFQKEILGTPPKLGHLVRAASHILRHYRELDVFLRSGRYRGTPESIARAMAGAPNWGCQYSIRVLTTERLRSAHVPGIDWRSSLP